MTKVNLQFLDVGWGDAHLIRLPSGCLTLIDGGDGTVSPDQDHPVSWMDRQGIEHLDWLILTHIHEDHLNGLLDIARAKSVSKAVLPYEPFKLMPEKVIEQHGNDLTKRVYGMLTAYLELIHLLGQQGTEILWRNECGTSEQAVLWSEEGVSLTHLYPWAGDPLPAYETLLKSCEGDDLRALESFFDLSNDDSSVYRLSFTQDPDKSILFGGDQLEAGWERLAQRMDIQSWVWKVSHHGLPDGFNPRLISLIKPAHCIIPISADRSENLRPAWESLRSCTDAAFYVTGHTGGTNPQRIESESAIIEIGYGAKPSDPHK
ncbi:ComEC/Rec2 family competence protein [Cohnella silvisoli]|uniref:MBL fold metallo-hydrolase n=1 Tax=Cohnella silvisoli TaxID=2873699 RepID=A0ABV1L0P5_9BACL|nr:MBL fold metallo-hydrolase [Cohnella silvisoli]MCD9025084.1 MBL fold metallo-hydrolase [Cohnella silvisoli]